MTKKERATYNAEKLLVLAQAAEVAKEKGDKETLKTLKKEILILMCKSIIELEENE